jgi:integral membrane protein
MTTAFGRYRVMAYVTGLVLLVACFVAIPMSHVFGHPGFGKVVWTLHGWLYLIYLMTAVHLAMTRKWRVPRTVLVLLAGTIPFMSFYMERRVSADEQPSLQR